jgi:hypothetical protein
MDVLNLRKLSLLVLTTTTILLAACTRSASALPIPVDTQDPLESIFSTVATQTALAAGPQDPQVESTAVAGSATGTATALFGSTSTLAASPTTVPTQTTTPAPTEELSVPARYTLHLGEWPYCLARRFDIESSALLAANGLTESQAANLSVGYELVIPTGAESFGGQRALRPHPTTYVSNGNDTFYSIACSFGDVWPEHIAAANGMDLEDGLQGGVTLHIP